MTINNSFNNPSCSNFTLKAMARLGVFNAKDQKGHEGSIVNYDITFFGLIYN